MSAKKIAVIVFTGIAGLAMTASFVGAQDFTNLPVASGAPQEVSTLVSKITTVIKWIQYALFIAATVLIVLAAFDYLFSKGDPEKIKTAQNTLIYAVIALVIGVLAGGIPKIIVTILNVT